MSRLPIAIKERAIRLRIKGFSIKEIAQKTHIAQGTSSVWLRNIKLNKKAQDRLRKRKLFGYYKAALHWQQKQAEEVELYRIKSLRLIEKIKKDPHYAKVYCALLFWCEGGKSDKAGVKFVNSDPILVKTFLNLLRKSFFLREKKLHLLMHLHEYHNENRQKDFWSRITGIPKNQFCKTYLKRHTKKRLRDSYPGCVCLSYHDVKVARELKAIYNTFAESL